MNVRRGYLVVIMLIAAIMGQLIIGAQAYAVNPADFNAGRIIDDELFYKKDDMNVSQIQAFLDAHVPPCDTWGTAPSGYGNLTRAQYAQQVMGWHGPPYACLDNYHENPDTGATSFENGGGAFPGGISAAQIIHDAAQQYGINPKVLLVTLRKESLNLFGDVWPLKSQYKYAMGYACPDSGPNYSAACVDSKSGFYKQMTLAAWQFRYYYDNMGSYSYAPGRWNTIQYSPNPACGTKEVFIENYATASLYIYTPYTPNDAALNAYPGTAHCGAYGNRNFWFMWQEWFGSTLGSLDVSQVSISQDAAGQTFTGKPVKVSFTARNLTKSNFSFTTIGVAVRDPNGKNMDPGWDNNVVIPPGKTYTYTKTFTPTIEGQYRAYLSSYASGDSDWKECVINNSQSNCKNPRVIQKPISIVEGIEFSDVDTGSSLDVLRQDREFVASYSIKNTSTVYPVKVGQVMVAGRTSSGANRDLGLLNAGTIGPQQTFTYQKNKKYSEVAANNKYYTTLTKDGGKTWEEAAFIPEGGSRQIRMIDVRPSVVMMEGPKAVEQAVVGGAVNLTVKVKNYSNTPVDLGRIGVIVRGPQGQNRDPGWQRVDNLSASTNDGVYTYQASFVPSVAGNWSVSYTQVSSDMKVWNAAYPTSDTGDVKRSIVVPVLPQATVTEGVSASSSVLGNSQITFTVANHSPAAIDLGKVGLVVRDPDGMNRDPLWQEFVLPANSTKQYSVTMNLNKRGRWTFVIGSYTADGTWKTLTSDEVSVNQLLELNVR